MTATSLRTDIPSGSATPFLRVCRVELRKQLDTRAGRWLMASVVAVNTILLTLTLVFAVPEDLTWLGLTSVASVGQMFLLPLIGVMAATSEWAQRTALTTFVLEPRRTRVNAGKLISAVALGLVVMAATVGVGAVLNVVGIVWRDGDGSWAMPWAALGGLTLTLVLLVVQGVAFGLALLSTPLAIVAYLALPTAWSALTNLVTSLQPVAQWLDLNVTIQPLTAGQMTPSDWPKLLVSVLVWIVVPLGLGLWRTARRDVT